MKEHRWLDPTRAQPRVEDLKPFLKEHKEKVTGKRDDLIQLANDLLSLHGFQSDFWKTKNI